MTIPQNSPSTPVSDFITAVKQGNRNFFDILKIPEQNFTDASFDLLMANQDDVLSGVNRALIGFHPNFFNVFTNCLVKYHDNGEVKFIFYITTSDFPTVCAVANTMFDQFGKGIYDDDKGLPFTKTDKIKLLSMGIFKGEQDNLLHTWSFDNTFWLLQYKAVPLQQFSLMVTISVPKKKDFSIRRNGTILDLLNFDIEAVLKQTEITREENFTHEKLTSVDYLFSLQQPVLGNFKLVQIRIFDAVRVVKSDVTTMVTFYALDPVGYEQKAAVMEKLIKMYGLDNGGSGELELYERDILEANKFYIGRNWHFNEQHGISSVRLN